MDFVSESEEREGEIVPIMVVFACVDKRKERNVEKRIERRKEGIKVDRKIDR